MPWMTVAENLLLRDEPRGPARLIRRRELVSRADELFDQLGVSGIDPYDLPASLSLAQRQVIEIARALLREPADPLPRRADLGALGAGGRVAVRPRPRPARPRQVRDLHLASLGRGGEPRRPDHDLQERRARRDPRPARRGRGGDADDRPDDRPDVPGAAGARERSGRVPRRPRPPGRAGARRVLRASPRRDPRHRRPGGPGAARPVHDALRRRKAIRRRDPDRRQAGAHPAAVGRDQAPDGHRARARGPEDGGADAADVGPRQPDPRGARPRGLPRRPQSGARAGARPARGATPPDPHRPAVGAGGRARSPAGTSRRS